MGKRILSFLLKGLVAIILILGYVLIQEFLNPLMLTRIALIFAIVIHPSGYIVFALILIFIDDDQSFYGLRGAQV